MKVREAVKLLQELDQDAEMMVFHEDHLCCGFNPLEKFVQESTGWDSLLDKPINTVFVE